MYVLHFFSKAGQFSNDQYSTFVTDFGKLICFKFLQFLFLLIVDVQ